MASQNKRTRIPVPANAVYPLAKAMEKKTKSTKKPNPETWFDEKIESVSQKQQVQSKTEHEKRKEALFLQLKQTEEELLSMQGLLDQREKIIKEADEERESQKENETEDSSKGADAGDGSEQPEKITKKTMRNMRDRMQDMRDKLHKMNRETDSFLADIENTMQYLESLETASDRLGPLSAETRTLFGGADDEQIIAEIYKENDQTSEGKNAGREMEVANHENGRKDEEDNDAEEEEEIRDKSDASKFFLTERTATSNHVVLVPNPTKADDEQVQDDSNDCDTSDVNDSQ